MTFGTCRPRSHNHHHDYYNNDDYDNNHHYHHDHHNNNHYNDDHHHNFERQVQSPIVLHECEVRHLRSRRPKIQVRILNNYCGLSTPVTKFRWSKSTKTASERVSFCQGQNGFVPALFNTQGLYADVEDITGKLVIRIYARG